MAIGAALAVGAVASAVIGGNAAKKAADQQAKKGKQALALQREVFDKAQEDARPFIEVGTRSLQALQSELGLGEAPEGFGGFQESPGFKFAFQKGVDAVDASAAAGGGLFSGSTLQDLTKFGQGFASQQRGTFLDRLQGLVNTGQTSAGQASLTGTAFANRATNTLEGIGNVNAAGTIGRANATIGGINSLSTIAGQFAGGFGGGF